MIKHVVMFKLKERSRESIEEAAEKIRNMKGKISVVDDLEVGVDFMKSDRSYDLILNVQLSNKDALKEYAEHPIHQPVLAYLKDAAEDIVAVDYKI